MITELAKSNSRSGRQFLRRAFSMLLGASVLSATAFAADPEVRSLRWKIKPLTVDANEGIDLGDIDGDGKLDVVAGRNWYASSEFVAKPVRNIADWNGYVESNGDYLVDVNRDGRLDVIAGSFLPTKVFWYENPGPEGWRLGKQWTEHLLVETGRSQNEGQLLDDVDGDGAPEWVVNSWDPKSPTIVWRLSPTTLKAESGEVPTMEAVPHVLGESSNGHGMGVGDINQDGKKDVLVGTGWYEQPSDGAWTKPWKFHPDWNLQASVPMIVVDVDKDGKNDILWGNGHDFGLFWWRATGIAADGTPQWEKITIDRSFSEAHALAWVDLDKDGQPELISGKRYYAHNGGDPGGQEPPVLAYFTWNPKDKSFTKHVIERGTVGSGLQVRVGDVDGNGWVDIAVAGKSGTYVLLNQGH